MIQQGVFYLATANVLTTPNNELLNAVDHIKMPVIDIGYITSSEPLSDK